MPKIGGFAASSVARGFPEDRFAHFSERDQRDLLQLMARIAEKSYRRGVQQGAEVSELRGNLCAWRYGRSLDRAPAADSPVLDESLHRLAIECGCDLRRLGLRIDLGHDDWRLRRCWVGYTTAQRHEWRGEPLPGGPGQHDEGAGNEY